MLTTEKTKGQQKEKKNDISMFTGASKKQHVSHTMVLSHPSGPQLETPTTARDHTPKHR